MARENSKDIVMMDWKEASILRSKLFEISKILTLYDMISLTFLLCEVPKSGLDLINSLFSQYGGDIRNKIFYKWLRDQTIFKNFNWQDRLAEALTVLQNYRSIKILGFDKLDAQKNYQPKNNLKPKCFFIIRKVLYNLCEDLTQKQSIKLIDAINYEHNLFDKNVIKIGVNYFEYILLLLNEKEIINFNEEKDIKLDNLMKWLQMIGYNKYAVEIRIIVDKINCQIIRKTYDSVLGTHECVYYPIVNKNNMGFCIIINEKIFSNPLFGTRWGTEKDVERLVEVFTSFGFIIRVLADLSYKQLIKSLTYYAGLVEQDHSAFILIILSHGSENIIYSSDSQAVDINTIEMVFQAETCPNLIGKPKVFIVQSCQGQKWQKMFRNVKESVDCDFATPSTLSQNVLRGPQRGDAMIAWSTVQGFASFRDKFNGSWYIEELCKELWRFGDISDFTEIFTRVNNNLRSKTYGDQFMVPSLLLSLRAKIKFPQLKVNEIEARRLLLNRLFFERYLLEFLRKSSTNSSSELWNCIKEQNRSKLLLR